MKRFGAIFFFCSLITSIAAFSQDRGIVECQGQPQIPAWTAPESAYVIDQLSCGQMVSVVGLERGYMKIQIGERFAYVDAKYVRTAQAQEQGVTQLKAQAKNLQQQALVQREEADKEFGFSGAGFITHQSPVFGVFVVQGTIGKYFKESDYIGVSVAPGIQFGNGETNGDIFYSVSYRHLFGGKNSKVVPFVGALGGALSIFGGGQTTTWGTAAPEVGFKIYASRLTAFEVAYQMPIALNGDVWGQGFGGRSISFITFGIKHRFGGGK